MSILLPKNRQRGFESLVGVAYEGVSTDFPSTITLPQHIHDRTVRAAAATDEDCRERSAAFSYRSGRWRGRLALRGAGFRANSDGTVQNTGSKLQGWRIHNSLSHISMHTHPVTFDRQCVKNSELLRRNDAAIKRDLSVLAPTPSPIDLHVIYHIGTVGSLIASSAGNFLAVRRELMFLDSYPAIVERGPQAAAKAEELFANMARSNPPEQIRAERLGIAATLLAPDFACYATSNAADPTMQLITPAA